MAVAGPTEQSFPRFRRGSDARKTPQPREVREGIISEALAWSEWKEAGPFSAELIVFFFSSPTHVDARRSLAEVAKRKKSLGEKEKERERGGN